MKHGQIELILPDGMKVEIGVTQENKYGELKIKGDYCWVITSQHGRQTSIDAYNLGLKFADDEQALVLEDKFIDSNGEPTRRLDVV
jgi:hypothetical protein